jgi:hypothetical protein
MPETRSTCSVCGAPVVRFDPPAGREGTVWLRYAPEAGGLTDEQRADLARAVAAPAEHNGCYRAYLRRGTILAVDARLTALERVAECARVIAEKSEGESCWADEHDLAALADALAALDGKEEERADR